MISTCHFSFGFSISACLYTYIHVYNMYSIFLYNILPSKKKNTKKAFCQVLGVGGAHL